MKKTQTWTSTYGLSADVKQLAKKFNLKKQISYEGRIMFKQLFWLKIAIALFLIEIGFYAIAIYKLSIIIRGG